MSLEDKLHKKALEKKPATAPAPVTAATGPADGPGDALGLDDLFQRCDARVPAGARGSSPEEVAEALRPFFDLDRTNLRLLCTTLPLGFTMSSLQGVMCAGVGMCPRCGDYQNPIGAAPGIATVTCPCGGRFTLRVIEYSHRVGQQIRELLRRHERSLNDVTRAYQLREEDKDAEAAALLVKVAGDFRGCGNRPAEAEALVLAAGFHLRTEPARARALFIDAIRIWIELRDAAGLARALYDFASMELTGRRRPFIGALLRLLTDACSLHEPMHETLKQRAQALFLEAAALTYSAAAVAEANQKLAARARFLAEAGNSPGGRKLLGIADRFDFVQQKLGQVQAPPADLLARASAAQKANQLEDANRLFGEAASVCAKLGDLAAVKQIVNQLVLLSFQRQDLTSVLAHLETMEWACRELDALKDLAVTLKNRAEVLKLFEDAEFAAEIAAKTAEAEQIEQRLETARRSLPEWRAAAEKAVASQAWREAVGAWQAIVAAAGLLGEDLEHMQALAALADCQAASGDPASAVYTLLELEAITEGREPLPFYPQALTTQAALWIDLGDAAIAAGRLARATLSWDNVHRRLPDNLTQAGVRELPQKKRYECYARLRALGDERADRADRAGALTLYRLAVRTGEECLKGGGDRGLILAHASTLDELGITLAKGDPTCRTEMLQLVRQALTLVDTLDQQDPAGAAARAAVRQEIADHLRDLEK